MEVLQSKSASKHEKQSLWGKATTKTYLSRSTCNKTYEIQRNRGISFPNTTSKTITQSILTIRPDPLSHNPAPNDPDRRICGRESDVFLILSKN